MIDSAGSRQAWRVLDGLTAFWVGLWVVLGLLTGYEVRQLTAVSDSAVASARAADRAGQALQSLRDLPLVGGDAGGLGDDVREAAQEVQASAVTSRAVVERLGVLLGLSIVLIPVTPVLWLYVPSRLAYRADVAALRGRLRAGPLDDALAAYLAARAVDRLPYRELRTLTEDPTGDLREGRYEVLARAELHRLGLTG
jgi:hypothetical protein